MRRAPRLAALLVPVALALPVAAEEAPPPDAPAGETVISARGREEDRFEAARSVSATDGRRTLELQARSVPEALEELAGVHVQRTSAGGGVPFLRGLVGPDNLVLVDGFRFNNSTFRSGPNQYLAVLAPYAFGRIEAVRGPSSVRYGDGAMGGVIQLFSHRPTPDGGPVLLSGDARVQGSSADLGAGASTLLQLTAGPVGVQAGGAWSFSDRLRPGGGGRQDLSEFNLGGANVAVRYRSDPRWSLDASWLFSALLDHGRGDDLAKGDARRVDNLDHLATVAFHWRDAGLVRRADVVAGWHRTDETTDRWNCALDARTPDELARCAARDDLRVDRLRVARDTVDTFGGSAGATLGFLKDRILVSGGVDAYGDLVSSGLTDARAAGGWEPVAQPRGGFSDGSRYVSLGAFAHGEVTVWDFGDRWGRLVASGGPRVSHFRASASGVPQVGDVRYDHTGVVGGASLQWVRPDLFNVYASFDEGFRAPNLQETTVLGDTGDKFEVPNPGLRPQRSETLEAGVRYRFPFVTVEVAGFTSWLRDLIDETDTTWEGRSTVGEKAVKVRINKSRGRFHGVDGRVAARWRGLGIGLDATWMRGDVEQADGTIVPARRIPPVFGRGWVRWDDPARWFWVEGAVRWAAAQERLHPGDRQDLRICADPDRPGKVLEGDACEGTPGWYAVDLRGGVRLPGMGEFELAVANVTDHRIRTHGSGVWSAGVDARVTMRVRF